IAKYGLTTAGFGHATEKVIRGNNDGLPIEAFIHRWKTERTETYTDSEGHTRTRTVTENHSEIVSAIMMPFSLPMLSWGVLGVARKSNSKAKSSTIATPYAPTIPSSHLM